MLQNDTRDATRRRPSAVQHHIQKDRGGRLNMGSQKGLVQRIERKLEVTVGDAFARVFGGSIVPQELEALLRREAAEGIRPVAGNRLLAPNEYIITLGMHDYQKVGADPDLTSDAFAQHLAGYIGEQGRSEEHTSELQS